MAGRPIRSRFLTATPVEEHGLIFPNIWIGLPAASADIRFKSSTEASVSLATSITITKPSGLAVGDLLICDIGTQATTTQPTVAVGWERAFGAGDNSGIDRALTIQWKIADAADVAASNFTFTVPSNGSTHGVLSAWTYDEDEIRVVGKGAADYLGGTILTPAVTNPTSDALAYTSMVGSDRDATPAVQTSGYTDIQVTETGTVAHGAAYDEGVSAATEQAEWNDAAHQYTLAVMVLFESYTPSAPQKLVWRSRSTAASSGTSFVVPAPDGIEAGDLLVALITKDDDPAVTSPSGWTTIVNQGNATGNDQRIKVDYKVATSADETATDYTWTGDDEPWQGQIHRYAPTTAGETPTYVTKATDKFVSNVTGAQSTNALTPSAGNLLVGVWGIWWGVPNNNWAYISSTLMNQGFDDEWWQGSSAYGTGGHAYAHAYNAAASSTTYSTQNGFSGSQEGWGALVEFTSSTSDQSISVVAAAEVETAATVSVQGASPQSISVVAAAETETAAAVAVDSPITVEVSPAAETETAQAVGANQTISVIAASETETAAAVGVESSATINVVAAAETETAGSVTPTSEITIPVTAAAEVETAETVTMLATNTPQNIPVAAAAELETAATVLGYTDQVVSVVAASETETAASVTATSTTVVAVIAAAEIETATSVAPTTEVTVIVGSASEIETAQSVGIGLGVVAAAEIETSQSVGGNVAIEVVAASEVETAQTVTSVAGGISVSVVAASETEAATAVGPVAGPTSITVVAAAETETAANVTPIAPIPFGGPPWTYGVSLYGSDHLYGGTVIASDESIPVVAASEVETATTVGVYAPGANQSISVVAAAEVETAVAVVTNMVNPVVAAAEVETAVAIGISTTEPGDKESWGMIPIGV